MSTRSPYRKVEIHMWQDAKFCALSSLPPSGQSLWLYLLTNPHTTAVPGLFRAGRAAMAEELGWTLEAFDEAFGEAFALGMVEADWEARVVWLHNALRPANAPESLNVAKAWRKTCDCLPECDLKRRAIAAIREFLAMKGEAFLAAFDEIMPSLKATSKPTAKPSAKATAKASVKPTRKTSPIQRTENRSITPLPPKGERFDEFWDAYPRKEAKAAAQRAWQKLGPDPPLVEEILRALRWQRQSVQWTRDGGQYVPLPASWLNGRRWEDARPADVVERRLPAPDWERVS